MTLYQVKLLHSIEGRVMDECYIQKAMEMVVTYLNVSLAGTDENHEESQDSQSG
jgi:hypothetical protein